MKSVEKEKCLARISWNRLSKEVTYKSVSESPKLKILFKQKKDKFVCEYFRVDSNGYSSRDLQHKLEQITQHVNNLYSNLIK